MFQDEYFINVNIIFYLFRLILDQHRCSKNDLFFKNLYQCKSLIFKLPMHGVYQVITDSNDEVPLYGFIVENSADVSKELLCSKLSVSLSARLISFLLGI